MRPNPFLLLITALPAALAIAQDDEKSSQSDTAIVVGEPKPITIGQSFKLKSKVFDAEREVNVYLPPTYAGETKKKFNVLYVVDGGRDQDFPHIAGLSQLAFINGVHERLIVVGVRTEVRIAEMTHEPTDPRYIRKPPMAGKSNVFRKHLLEEVVPFVEGRYRTGDRKAIMGESLAGLFVVEAFLKHPKSFTDYISVSPSLWFDNRSLAKSASVHLTKHDNSPRRLYLTMANEGGTMQKGLDELLVALKEHAPKTLKLHYVDRRKSETHASIYHGAAHDALRKLFDLPDPDYGPPAWYMIEGGQPPKRNDKK